MTYPEGVQDLGNGLFAYMQDCNQGMGWGWSNAGLIVDGDESLMIDTLRDELMTHKMLESYRDATGLDRKEIGVLVNTHRDADHTYGNRLMSHARIVATEACKRGIAERPPTAILDLLQNRPEGPIGDYIFRLFGPPFEFQGVNPTLPNETFTGRYDLKVGDKDVHMIEVGPAHTASDVLVHVPSNRAVYTGDIVFLTNTPVIWEGPHENWVAALDLIMSMDVDTVIPGHGPITDKAGVAKVKQYFEHVERESRRRYDAGLSLAEAIQDVALGEFEDWGGSERIVVNVSYFYGRFSGTREHRSLHETFALMAPLAERARKRKGGLSPAAPETGGCCPH